MLEADSGFYFAHSLQEGGMPRVNGYAFLNPRDTWKSGYGLPVLFGQEPATEPALIWKSRYGSVTFNPLGRELPDGGMNEAGLFIWEMGFGPEYPTDERLPILFQMQWMQYQLDNYATVEEVTANVDRVALDGWGWHYFVADRSGNAAIIDHLDGSARVYTGSELPLPLCTNSSYPVAMEFLSEHEGFGGDIEITQTRFGTIPVFIYGAKLLSEHTNEEPVQYCLDTLDAMGTGLRWSVVFDAQNTTAHFTTNVEKNRRSFKFSPEDFDPALGSRMLDVNATGTGDVRPAFLPYDREADVVLLAGILELFDEVSDGTIAVAEAAVARLDYRDLTEAYDIRGAWNGSVTVPDEGAERVVHLTLTLDGDDGVHWGTLESDAFERPLPLHNVRLDGGLLDFTSRDPDTGELVHFQLYLTGSSLRGSSTTWDWNTMESASENLVSPVVEFSRS